MSGQESGPQGLGTTNSRWVNLKISCPERWRTSSGGTEIGCREGRLTSHHQDEKEKQYSCMVPLSELRHGMKASGQYDVG